MEDEHMKDLDLTIFPPSLEEYLDAGDKLLELDVEDIFGSHDNQKETIMVDQPQPLQLEDYSGFTFTNQLGQFQEKPTNFHQLTANSSPIFIPCQATTDQIQESLDQIVTELQIPKPPPKKRGRKPNLFKKVKEKKAKLYDEYNLLEPEKNSKQVTDAYNARLTRQKQKQLQDTLTKERDEAREQNLILKVQLQEKDVQLEEQRERIRELENQLMEKTGNCNQIKNFNQIRADDCALLFPFHDVEQMTGNLFEDVMVFEDLCPPLPLTANPVTL